LKHSVFSPSTIRANGRGDLYTGKKNNCSSSKTL
jgi:hypothetical protein